MVFQGDFLDTKSVDDRNGVLYFLNVPPGPRLYLGFSCASVSPYSPWSAHTADPSSSSPSLEPLPSIFSVYVAIASSVDVHLILYHQSIGPLYPFPNYEILKSMLIAASSYCAMSLVCCFVISPETVNHAYLGMMSTILTDAKTMLVSQDDLLSPQPGDFGPRCPKLKALIEIRVAVMSMYQSRNYPSHRFLMPLFTPWLFSEWIDNPPSKRVQRRSLERR